MLTLQRARELNDTMVTQEHLLLHALNVSYAMGAMAEHFGQEAEHWQAIGLLHDYDYEKYPEEHLQHTAEPLLAAGVEPEEVRAILSHGYGICTDVEPLTEQELHEFSEAMKLTASQDPRPTGWRAARLASPCPSESSPGWAKRGTLPPVAC